MPVPGLPPDHRRCRATTKNGPHMGERCHNWLPLGWLVCRYHGGLAPAHVAKATRRRAVMELERELDRLGTPLNGANPIDVLRDLVAEWAGNLGFWRRMMQQIQEAGAAESASPTFPYKSGTIYAKYEQASDRLAHYSKLAMEAGLDEAETHLIRQQGELLARAMQHYAAQMGVINDPRSAPAMRAALTLVAGSADDETEATGHG